MKTAHVYIYGVIIDSWQEDNAVECGSVNLKSVKNQLENQGVYDEIVVHIHSDGGVVSEGFAIHDYIRSFGKPVTTQIEGNCFSIATVIALAGDKRTMTSNAEFLIHNPWGYTGGEKEDIQKYADELDKLEDKIADFYASKTNLSKEQALDFMKVETTFTPEQALEKGFITEIAQVMRAVALYRPNKKNSKNKSKNKEMSNKTLNKQEVDKKINLLIQAFNGLKDIITGKSKPTNLVIQDANGDDIDFYELEDGATPKEQDKARVNSEDAQGEYVMPSGETYVFDSGVLVEIKPVEDDGDDDSEEMESLKKENEDLKSQIEALSAKFSDFEKEIYDLKENISSSFNYDPKIEPKKKELPTTRQLFKK